MLTIEVLVNVCAKTLLLTDAFHITATPAMKIGALPPAVHDPGLVDNESEAVLLPPEHQ